MKIKAIFFGLMGLIIFTGIIFYLYLFYREKVRATTTDLILDGARVKQWRLVQTNNVGRFSFYGQDQFLSGESTNDLKNLGIKSFLGKNISFKNNETLESFLPAKVIEQLSLINQFAAGNQHFYYQQNIDATPVYGSYINLHLNQDNQVYGFDGSVIYDENLPKPVISDEEAQNIALNRAKEEVGTATNLYVFQAERYVLNKKVLGISEDDANYLTLAVSVRTEEATPVLFAKKYFVNLENGEIIYEEPEIIYALNRVIKDYRKNQQTVRKEGDLPIGDQSVDQTYDNAGLTYDFYFNNLQRDSYDNKGAQIIAIVHLKDQSCPNAFFDSQSKAFYFCDGMTTTDIFAHEFTHGVTGNKLTYNKQSGALNESLSDIFASGVDGNWSLGEGSQVGIIRYINDPTQGSPPQPDRLFSSHYYCGSKDYGGVHTNGGVFSKAFYLMVEGGNFNGCSIQGIESAKAHRIIYQALTTYVVPTANFRDMYEAVNRACDELYGANSSDCFSVRQAMEATEMDQQPVGTQAGPKCTNAQAKPASCVGGVPPPTSSPTAIVPSIFSSIVPSAPVISPTDAISPTSSSPSSITPLPTAAITPSGNISLELKLKLQGIEKKPKESLNQQYIKLTLVSNSGESHSSTGLFHSDDQGIWKGEVFFNFNLNSSKKYKLLVKGPQHIQKRICDDQPQEEKEGYYRCSEPNLSLKPGENTFDFSQIVLLAGDLPEQDGVVNSFDLSQIRQKLGSTAEESQVGDINLDGVVDTQDYSLVIFSLSTRFDE